MNHSYLKPSKNIRFLHSPLKSHLLVNIPCQELIHFENSHIIGKYAISTALKGVGEKFGSEQTPRGWHMIRAKIGKEALPNTVFVGRRPTGEIYHPNMKMAEPHRDWILTRILWLSGLEHGKNRLGNCDTMRRFVYIHGVPDSTEMGVPGSRGCINMRNADIIKLFNAVAFYTPVFIQE